MAITERDVVFTGKDENGNTTFDFPITRLGNIEDTATEKEAPNGDDFLPVIDSGANGEMKKVPLKFILDPIKRAQDVADRAAEAVKNFVSVINSPPVQSDILTYSGEPQAPTWSGYDPKTLDLVSGAEAQTNAGTYTAKFKPKEGYHWWDGTEEEKDVQWAIGRKTVPVPSQKKALTYNEGAQSPEWDNYVEEQLTLGGDTEETNAGTYDATFTPTDNYQWNGGDTSQKTVRWTIGRANVEPPTQEGTLSYTGEAQQPAWTGHDPKKLTLGGQTSATAVGTYQATFTPTDNYQWSDGTTGPRNVPWTIGNATLTIPTQKGSLTYQPSTAQAPQWNDYDDKKMTLGGETTGTNAGSYNATFTPKTNYQWPDTTQVAKTVPWTIGKATGTLQLSTQTVNLNVASLTATVNVTRPGTGAISAVSNAPQTANAQVSGNVITITGLASGSCKVTVTVAQDNNYTAPASQDITVQVAIPSKTLDGTDPSIIQQVAKAGKGADYWKAGDRIKIALKGTVGTLALSSDYYATIIGFNHNASAEDAKSIDFQFAATADGTPIAFVDSGYNSYQTSGFVMNTTQTNAGGWKGSYMYKTICPAMLAAMPTAWQNIIVMAKKWTDNTGGGSDNAGNVTQDAGTKIWLLSEFEVQGKRTYANSAEQNHQLQYAYYANGNNKVRKKHNDTGTACTWWLRSPYYTYSDIFCYTNAGGSAGYADANRSRGFAPGFRVA